MKIGILTLPFNNNYGGYLQAYALMTVLKRMGHNVELIYRKHNKRSFVTRSKLFIKSIIKCLLKKEYCCIIPNQEKELRHKGINMMGFVDKYISPKTLPVYSSKELSKYGDLYDAVIVGSDQVWRPDYVPNIEDFFLCFINGTKTKKIAYAASFGGGKPLFNREEISICGDLISKFDYVGVREESGCNIINNYGWIPKKKPIVVLDPTMLLPKSDYDEIIDIKVVEKEYVASYVLDECFKTDKLITQISEQINMPIKTVLITKEWKKTNYKMPSINYWLESIRNAGFMVTDSFHGTVFSIIFNVPFIVIANKNRGIDRFETILHHFGLEDRILTNEMGIETIAKSPINWVRVNKLLNNERQKSISFLNTALSD